MPDRPKKPDTTHRAEGSIHGTEQAGAPDPSPIGVADQTESTTPDEPASATPSRTPTRRTATQPRTRAAKAKTERPAAATTAAVEPAPKKQSSARRVPLALTIASSPPPEAAVPAPAHAPNGAPTSAPARAAVSPQRPKPARGGGGRGAPRGFSQRFGREAAGILLVLVLAVVCAVAVAAVAAKGNADAAMAAKQSASYRPPTPTTPPGVAATDPTVVVIGDETVTTSSSGVSTADRWPALLDKAVTGKVAVSASAGAGYTTAGSSGLSFADQAATIPASAKVVVFFGGLNDVDALALDVSKAATTAFSAAKKAAPKAKFIVVGPVVGGAVSASDVVNLRNALKMSAGIADFTWIDPISKSWVADSATKQATTLTTTDEAAISKKVATAVSKALG